MLRTALAFVVLPLAFALGFSSKALGQDGTPEDTEQFARLLGKAGYHDLGKEVAKAALEATASPDAKAVLEYALANIAAEEAYKTSDPATRVKNLESTVQIYETYIKKYPSSKRLDAARFEVSDLLRFAGDAVA